MDDDALIGRLPARLELQSGAHLGAVVTVALGSDGLRWSQAGPDEDRSELVLPSEVAWGAFERWLEVVDPWCWNGEYRLPPGEEVMDGAFWSLRLTWWDRHVDCSGENAYPPYGEGPEPSAHWEVLCAGVERLLGGALPVGP
jgi:hypothetical protein